MQSGQGNHDAHTPTASKRLNLPRMEPLVQTWFPTTHGAGSRISIQGSWAVQSLGQHKCHGGDGAS